MAILVGIDGTGGGHFRTDAREKRYDADFANSFVRRLCPESRIDGKYFRGPVSLGGGLVDAVDRGFELGVATLERRANLTE